MYREFPTWYRDVPEYQLQDWRAVGWPAVLERLNRTLYSSRRNFTLTRSRGRRLIMSCCFHEERTPSLSLYANGGFVCYGCGQAGSISDFVMILMDFLELEDLHRFFNDAFRASHFNDGQLTLPLAV